jgi:hypothetical protein
MRLQRVSASLIRLCPDSGHRLAPVDPRRKALGPPGIASSEARAGKDRWNPKEHKEPDNAQRVAPRSGRVGDGHGGTGDVPNCRA